MKALEYAKNKLEMWLGRDVHYAIPEKVKTEDFLFQEIDGNRYLTIRQAKSIAQHIVYPEQREQSIWHDNVMAKLVKSVEKMFQGSYFDICVVHKAVADFDLRSSASVSQASQDLHRIHCMDFADMTPEVFAAIPRYMTHIFTEGRVPLEEVVLKEEQDHPPAKPEAAEPPALVRELSDLANDALVALAMGNANPETLEALRTRQRQALDKMLGEYGCTQ